jgi:uncharacterized protein (UPF0333 family)
MDQRAQISVEYILLVAIILFVVLIFASVVINGNEENNVASAVQLGASNATANMVFTNTSQPPVKVTNVTMTNVINSTQVTVTIRFSGPISNPTPVFNSIANSLIATGYSNITQNSTALTLTTQSGSGIRHIYTITLG